jgi:hypothetical protein
MTPKQIVKQKRDELSAKITVMKQRHEEAQAQEAARKIDWQNTKEEIDALDAWLAAN